MNLNNHKRDTASHPTFTWHEERPSNVRTHWLNWLRCMSDNDDNYIKALRHMVPTTALDFTAAYNRGFLNGRLANIKT